MELFLRTAAFGGRVGDGSDQVHRNNLTIMSTLGSERGACATVAQMWPIPEDTSATWRRPQLAEVASIASGKAVSPNSTVESTWIHRPQFCPRCSLHVSSRPSTVRPVPRCTRCCGPWLFETPTGPSEKPPGGHHVDSRAAGNGSAETAFVLDHRGELESLIRRLGLSNLGEFAFGQIAVGVVDRRAFQPTTLGEVGS